MSEEKLTAEQTAEVAAPAAEAPAQEMSPKLKAMKEKAAFLNASLEEKAALLPAASQLGIQNTLEIVKFGVSMAEAIEKSKADGKIGLEDIGNLFPVAPLVVPMIEGIGQVPKELGDLDDAELEVLLAEAAKLLGADAAVAVKVKASLRFAHAGYDLYMAFAKK